MRNLLNQFVKRAFMTRFVSKEMLGLRCYSFSSGNRCEVATDNDAGIAVVTLKKAPANSLDLEFLREMTSTISTLESDKTVKGLIITSGIPKIFSAGLDLSELHDTKKDRAAEFWRSLQDFWMKLYYSPLVTFAAINGNSPAGGCLVAISCDYRIMASSNYSIGFNETLLGIVAPTWFVDILKNTIGHRQAEKALELGRLFEPEEALKIGLVDEIAEEGDMLSGAKDEMRRWLKVPGEARALSKQMLRKETMDRLISRREEDINQFVDLISQDGIQKSLGDYLERLKKRKKLSGS